jgi:phosphatidylinositol alpha-1,6-mannosyltransferase
LRRAGINGKISVIFPGVDTVLIAPMRSKTPTILSVGRLIARKGFDTMIQAMPAILQRVPMARYEIVGAGPHRIALEELAKRLNVFASVDFLGSLSDDDMRLAYARAWCFSLPVRSVDNDVEGFGIVYLEAALAELPVIGGINSGAEDAIIDGETGLLVDGNSPTDVAAAVSFLLTDRENARFMGARGRNRAMSNFTWRHSAIELSNLFGTRQQSRVRVSSSQIEAAEQTSKVET